MYYILDMQSARGSGFGRPVRLLNLRRIRRQPLRAAVIVVTIAAGVAVASSVAVVNSSMQRSLREFARATAGPAPLRVVGSSDRAGLDEAVAGRVRSVSGVRAAIPMVQAVTQAEGASSPLVPVVALGFDCSIEAIVKSLACDPAALARTSDRTPPFVAPTLRRALGRDPVVRTDLGSRPLEDAPTLAALDRINQGHAVAYALPVAQRLFAREGSLDVIYVLPSDSADLGELRRELERAVGPHNSVQAGDEAVGLGPFLQLLVLLGLVSLFGLAVAGVLVYNITRFTIEERRRDLAVTAALGATPRVIVFGALTEAGIAGAAGGLLGAPVGMLVARPILASFGTTIGQLTGLSMRVHTSWTPFVIAVALGLGTALVGAFVPARRASRIDAVAELRNRDRVSTPAPPASAWRVVWIIAVVLAGVAMPVVAVRWFLLERWTPAVAQVGMLVSTVAVFFGAGAIGPFVFRLLRGPVSRRGPAARLGWANLTREGKRASVMVVASASALAFAFLLSSSGRSVRDSLARARLGETGSGLFVGTTPRNNDVNIEGKPSPDMIDALTRIPGVREVRRGAGLAFRSTSGIFSGAEASDGELIVPFKIIAGTADPQRFARGEVLIGPTLAREQGVRPGAMLRLPGKYGMVDVRVQGIWANGDFNGSDVTMPMELLTRIWGPQPPSGLLVIPSRGTSLETLDRRIEQARLDRHLVSLTPKEQVRATARDVAGFMAPFWAMQRGLLVIAFAAVLFTLLLVAVQRRREIGLLSAVGMEPASIARTVIVEAALVALVATVVGTVTSLPIEEAFRHTFFLSIPYEMPYRIDPIAPLVYGALLLVVLVSAAALPAWRSARLQVVEALRYE
jgi:putative ABC transport system permease protein